MKRWAWLTATLYFVILAALTVPVILLAFAPKVSTAEAVRVYSTWPYWGGLGVMFVSQLALLSVPVRVASRRPVSRRSLWPTLLAGGLMMAGLAAGAVYSIYELIVGEHGKGNWIAWIALGLGLLSWIIWTWIFARMSRLENAPDTISRLCRRLFKGSILELLIAVPTHIVARSRDYCCAGFMTFLGLTMGAAVMLFSFGPAVFFLFAERWRRLHPEGGGSAGGTRENTV